jgi:excisionase family DNA binding protein
MKRRRKNSKSYETRTAKARVLTGAPPVKAVSMLEAAAMLRVGRSTMLRLIRDQKIETFKIGRALRISTVSIDQFIRKSQQMARHDKNLGR